VLPIDHEASVTPIVNAGETKVPDAVLGLTGRPLPTFAAPKPLSSHGPAYIIAMTNQKGGVGKTTTTINLGAALAEAGRKVLMVDMDPQGSLSIGLGVNPDDLGGKRTVYDMLMDSSSVPASEVVMKTSVNGLDLLPANIQLSAAELRLAGEVAREYALDRAFESVRPLYDYILIDCQPSLGLLTVNALTAADGVVIPKEDGDAFTLIDETWEMFCEYIEIDPEELYEDISVAFAASSRPPLVIK
jgi:chromosome partitioning protein